MFRRARFALLILVAVAVAAVIGIVVALGSNHGSANPNEAIPHKHFTRLGWSTNCTYVTSGQMDGAAYDLFGGLPGSSRQGPIAGTPHPGSSCLRAPLDHSIYASAEMTINGQRQTPRAVYAYYLAPKHVAPEDVRAYPPGMQLVATHVQFSCAHGGSPRTAAPYDCRPHFPTQPEVDAWVTFPTCWDGHGALPSDVRYVGPEGCPAGYATPLPELQLQFTWSTPDGTGARFSTNPFRALWTNGWSPQALGSLVKNCINTPTACGSIINYFHRSPLPRPSDGGA